MSNYKCVKCGWGGRAHSKFDCPNCGKTVEPMDEHESKKFDEGVQAAEALINSLNAMCMENFVNQGFCCGIRQSHRTLQQRFGELLRVVIADFASRDKEGHYDMRNAGIVKMCAQINDQIKDTYLPFV